MKKYNMSEFAYIFWVKLEDDRVKRFGYPITTNTWVLVGEKHRLAKEYGVPLDTVTVYVVDPGAIL